MEIINGRDHSRRENPPERRKAHLDEFHFPHDSCEQDCPVAIRNHERIETLFKRLDEDRAKHGNCVQWKHFTWVAGGLFVIVMTVLTVVWNVSTGTDQGLVNSIEIAKERSYLNTARIDVVATRIEAFMNTHEDIMTEARKDQEVISQQIAEMNRIIRRIEIRIGNIEPEPKHP